MKEQLRVAITTLGCRSNQYDSSAIEEAVKALSMEVIPFPGPADAYIINTCTVTGATDRQSRQIIRKARRMNPQAVVIVTGCYAQVSPAEVAGIEGVDYVLGNPLKAELTDYLLKGRRKDPLVSVESEREADPFELRAKNPAGRTRANLKVQEGCNRSCAYCIIPKARGRARSMPLKRVLREIEGLVKSGFKEIVLTGIHLGSYGEDIFDTTITDLVMAIEREGFPCRFRLSSLDPDEVTDELIELIAGSKTICNHLHLPLQSGDDGILKKMKRRYRAETFSKVISKISASMPGAAVGADVIAGFPGEGEREFMNTVSLLEELPVSYLHVFPFSPRKDTPAATYPDPVDPVTVKRRCEELRRLDGLKRKDFYARHTGTVAQVLVESKRDRGQGLLTGRTSNYIPVRFHGGDDLKNRLVNVRIERASEKGAWGTVEEVSG